MHIVFISSGSFGMCGFNNYIDTLRAHDGRLIEWEIHNDIKDAEASHAKSMEEIPDALHDVMDMEVLPQWTQVVIDTQIQREEDGSASISHKMSRNACGTLDRLRASGVTWRGEGWNYYVSIERWDVSGGETDVARLKAMFGGVLDEAIDLGRENDEDGPYVDMDVTFSMTELLIAALSARGLEEEYVGVWPRKPSDFELVEDHALYELRYDSKHNSAVVSALAEIEMKVARMLAGIEAEKEKQKKEV